ncbi:MAG: DNA primase [Candidatus Heimdallarchaeota archaeon]|nr:DNA primase [Candidatus Heimdallarchaeota archaeon]MCK4954567.1 DNA primase [Candidatus Heimdallarchaeota archaeon]
MGVKTDASTMKYEIKASFEIDGVVEKPDIIGGIYGQTDGLLSENLDIRELQKTGRIGRISVKLASRGGKTKGKIIIPSSLSRMETAILAATLETVDRVGPCSSQIKLEEIVDVRIDKRKSIVDRASEIIRQWDQNVSPFSSEITLKVKKSSKTSQILSIGDEGISAGPGFEKQKKVVLVEGRADVVNLLKSGIDNTVAVNGTSVSPKLLNLIKKKTVTAFLDGDRGGDLILKELLQVAKINYVARAPKGKEVEELNKDQIKKALKESLPIDKAVFLTGGDEGLTVKEFQAKDTVKVKKTKIEPISKQKPKSVPTKKPIRVDRPKTEGPKVERKPIERSKPERYRTDRPPSDRRYTPRTSSTTTRRPSTTRRGPSARPSTTRRGPSARPPRHEIRKVELPEHLSKAVGEIKTKLEAVIFDDDNKEILRSPAAEIFDKLETIENGNTIVIDGVITQRLLERSHSKGIKMVIGARKGEISKKPNGIRIIEFKQI